MAGGVTGVSAGNRTSYDPSPTGLLGRGSAHGSISSESSSESVGLILTLRIPSSGREDAMAAYHKNPPPAEDYSVLSGRANVSKEEAETCTS